MKESSKINIRFKFNKNFPPYERNLLKKKFETIGSVQESHHRVSGIEETVLILSLMGGVAGVATACLNLATAIIELKIKNIENNNSLIMW